MAREPSDDFECLTRRPELLALAISLGCPFVDARVEWFGEEDVRAAVDVSFGLRQPSLRLAISSFDQTEETRPLCNAVVMQSADGKTRQLTVGFDPM